MQKIPVGSVEVNGERYEIGMIHFKPSDDRGLGYAHESE